MANEIEYTIRPIEESESKSSFMRLRVSGSGNMHIVHKAIRKQLHEKRQGSSNCKTRSQVRGGGRKPWKQKGTGRARAGSNRSPLWRGGGVIFGPKTKNYVQKVNKKERQLAIRNTLFNKKNFTFSIDPGSLNIEKPKTKLLTEHLSRFNKIDSGKKVLIIMAQKNQNIYLASRNLNHIEVIAANQINLLSIIRANYIMIERNAIEIITQVYNG